MARRPALPRHHGRGLPRPGQRGRGGPDSRPDPGLQPRGLHGHRRRAHLEEGPPRAAVPEGAPRGGARPGRPEAAGERAPALHGRGRGARRKGPTGHCALAGEVLLGLAFAPPRHRLPHVLRGGLTAGEGRSALDRRPAATNLSFDIPMTDNGETGVRWFYVQEGRRKGPLGVAELVALILGGAVPEDTLIWRAGLGEWVKANSVEEIQRELPPPIPGRDGGRRDQLGALSREEELDESERDEGGPLGTNSSAGSGRPGGRRR